jgi:NAD(P)H-dependent FMN reductase
MARVAVDVISTGDGSRRVLVVSGSTRSASTNTALCRTAPLCAPPGVEITVFDDCSVLPHFNPDDDHEPLPPPVVALRAAIADADAVLFCTPEYAGSVPGSLKNLLDWVVGGTEFTRKPTAWVKVATDARRGEGAHATLATVLRYVQAEVVASACDHIPISREMVGPDGLVTDPAAREAIGHTLRAILQHPTGLPVACTLGPDDGAERMQRWRELVGRAAPRIRRISNQLEVQFQPVHGVNEELEVLAAAEQQCCAFLTWTVGVDSEHPVLHVTASPDQPDNIEPIINLFGAT